VLGCWGLSSAAGASVAGVFGGLGEGWTGPGRVPDGSRTGPGRVPDGAWMGPGVVRGLDGWLKWLEACGMVRDGFSPAGALGP
jgi:hypothetical protein